MSKLDKLIKDLGIDESLTKVVKGDKVFTHVKDVIPEKEDYNFAADLLMLPETDKGYRYLLVVVDLWTDLFDIEPLKTKEPKEVLAAMKKMFKRKYLDKPYASIATDSGSEFKGVFNKWMYDESIFHKVAKKGRHTQMGNVERLNRTLGRLFNGLMNKKEEETRKKFVNWDQFVDVVRTSLNEYREERIKEIRKEKPTEKAQIKEFNAQSKEPKFKVGDVVRYKLDVPEDALGNELSGKFREGDRRWSKDVRKIKTVAQYDGLVPYRYILEGMDNVSYTENQLKLVADKKDTTYKVKEIIGERQRNKKKEYLIHWKGYKKEESTWEPVANLIEDFGEEHMSDLIQQFKESKKKPPAKEPVKKPAKKPVKEKPKKIIPVEEAIEPVQPTRRSSRLAAKK